MLFNSYSFIFYFLIPVVLVYRLIPETFKLWYLIFVSIIFYAQWNIVHLFILASSILVNYLFAYFISIRRRIPTRGIPTVLLFLVIGLNIGLLGYFKYSGFLNLSDGSMVLPLAISFFTFQQIAYIVDIYRGKIALESFDRYLFFVMFFPQLVAGPIVHYNYIMRQVDGGRLGARSGFGAGVLLFSMGLFSKVVIADNLIRESYNSWSDIFSYSFMIYFDFSGYANMAIGLALMFGILLPINFDSPYKATNLIEFWRKWHITLSDFLKNYIYIPFGGSRFGKKRQVVALMSTMVIGGIWHGAGWNFLLWGAMHGVGLVVVHLWVSFSSSRPNLIWERVRFFSGVIFTFLYVTLLWVLFFSNNIEEAFRVYQTLFSFDKFGLKGFDVFWLLGCAIIVWGMPNSIEFLDIKKRDLGVKYWYAYLSAFLLFVSLKVMAESPSINFVYFNF